MTPRQVAFDGLVEVAHQLATARGAQILDLVAMADMQTSVSDWRIALRLGHGLPIWTMDRNGNFVERGPA